MLYPKVTKASKRNPLSTAVDGMVAGKARNHTFCLGLTKLQKKLSMPLFLTPWTEGGLNLRPRVYKPPGGAGVHFEISIHSLPQAPAYSLLIKQAELQHSLAFSFRENMIPISFAATTGKETERVESEIKMCLAHPCPLLLQSAPAESASFPRATC